MALIAAAKHTAPIVANVKFEVHTFTSNVSDGDTVKTLLSSIVDADWTTTSASNITHKITWSGKTVTINLSGAAQGRLRIWGF